MYTKAQYRLSTVAARRLFGEASRGRSEQWRALAAKQSDEQKIPLPSALFHYNADGHPAQGLAPVRFHATESILSLIGVGAIGRELVYESGPLVSKLLMTHVKAPVPVDYIEGQNVFRWSNFDRLYHASSAVIGKLGTNEIWTKWLLESIEQKVDLLMIVDAKAQAEKVLTESLRRQLLTIHANGPGDRTCLIDPMTGETIDAAEDVERLHVKVLTTATVPVPTFGHLSRSHATSKGAKPKSMVALKRPVFAINAELRGEWAIGALLARGYGRLVPHLGSAELAKAA